MAVAHSKEVSPSILTQVWQHQETILVDFVRVLRRVAGLCCKRKLGHAIIELFAGLPGLYTLILLSRCDFLRNRSSDVVFGLLLGLLVVLVAWRVPHLDGLVLADRKELTLLVLFFLTVTLNLGAVSVILFVDGFVGLLVV